MNRLGVLYYSEGNFRLEQRFFMSLALVHAHVLDEFMQFYSNGFLVVKFKQSFFLNSSTINIFIIFKFSWGV